jgi:hypothetical protein
MANANFSVIQGDTFTRTVIFTVKSTGAAVDLTDCVVSGKAKVGGILLDLLCTITAPTAGTFTFGLTAAQTATLPPGTGVFDVQITFTDGSIQTIFSGNLVIVKQVS